MPISIDADLVIPTQDEFASLAFDVMDCFFKVHNEIGRFCDEKIYKREVAKRFGGIRLELPITLTHREYRKTYFADMLIRRCAIFEVKAAELLAPRHRAQASAKRHLSHPLKNLLPNRGSGNGATCAAANRCMK